MNLKLKLIDEWRHGWKFLSVQLATLAAAFQELPQFLPPWAHDALPGEWWGYIAKFLFVSALVSRFVKQANVPTSPPAAPAEKVE